MAVKKKVVKNPKVPRTRNNQTLTESAFWGMIRSCLRQKSRWWQPIKQCKENARRLYTGANKLQKWEFQCSNCKDWFMEKFIACDHKIEAGTLTCKGDVGDFIERLFVETEGLQILCDKRPDGKDSCHKKKTDEYMKIVKASKDSKKK